ncbi:C40 family peptidase [Granulosicoccus sp. 3-233]|uniref:C40 family peptidase n=1 Tax=Granulosicoccus sp. 3-233 TaxID=3417969 RepID=UPI003D32FB39
MTPDSTDQACRINRPVAAVLAEPELDAKRTSETLYGESVRILNEHGAWCHVRLLKDGYEGFMQRDHLETGDAARIASTHRVCQRSTLLFARADLKSQLCYRIPFGAEVALTEEAGTPFSRTSCGHYLWSEHCLPLSDTLPADPLTLARNVFLGSPYLWGGRSPEGVDCSGLVQALALSQGMAIPRDSGDQEAFLSVDVGPDDYQARDLAYWPGHTGILLSPGELLHATAHSLCCVIEPLQAVIDRAGPMSSVKRLF